MLYIQLENNSVVTTGEGELLTDTTDNPPMGSDGSPYDGFTLNYDNTETGFKTVGRINSVVVSVPDGEIIVRGDLVQGEQSAARVLISQEINPIKTGIIKPKYYQSDTLVNTSNGFYGYNSVYDLGILQSEFFTEIAIFDREEFEGIPLQEQWNIGHRVMGEVSGATARVEQYRKNYLTVSNIIGSFINGENIMQIQGPETAEDQCDVDLVVNQLLLSDSDKNNLATGTGARLLLNKDINTGPSMGAIIKTGRILREGEVIDLHFNSHAGSELVPDFPDTPSGGGDKISCKQCFQ